MTIWILLIGGTAAILAYAAYDKVRPKCIVCKRRFPKAEVTKVVDGLVTGDEIAIGWHEKCVEMAIKNPDAYDGQVIFELNSVLKDLKRRKQSNDKSGYRLHFENLAAELREEDEPG